MQNDDEVLTPPQAVKKTAAYLAQKGITGNLRYEAEQLVADVLNTDRLGLYLWYDRPFSPEEKEKLRSYVRRRAFGEPSAYILGYTYFHSRRFRILADVLIPRPDSEELVMRTEESMTRYRTETGKNGQEKLRLLEIGCGSGALLCTLGTENQHLYLFGLDISAEAVKNSDFNFTDYQEKFTENHVSTELIQADIRVYTPTEPFDIIMSNPPYVSADEMNELPRESQQYEPRAAFYGGQYGLDFYRLFAERLYTMITPGGYLIMEYGWQQKNAVMQIFAVDPHWELIGTYQDINGKDRVITFRTVKR